MTSKSPAWSDPIVEEIHRIREEMAREADYDIHKLGNLLREAQAKLGREIVSLPRPKLEKSQTDKS